MNAKTRCLIAALVIWFCLTGLLTIADATTNNSSAIYGNTTTATLTPINDGVLTGVKDSLIKNNTSQVNPGKALWYLGKPFSLYIGNWWIVIMLAVIGGIILYSQGGSPLLLIAAFMIGNVVLWAFIPFDWLGSISAMAIFAISCVLVAVFKGRQTG